MTLKQMLLAGGLAVLAGPALADCTDRITFLEEALDDASRLAISASTGGQGVAGAREAQAVTEEMAEEPVPYQDDAAAAVEEADEAGDGGEELIEARARLGEARTLAQDGNEEACTRQIKEILVGLIDG